MIELDNVKQLISLYTDVFMLYYNNYDEVSLHHVHESSIFFTRLKFYLLPGDQFDCTFLQE